MDSSRLKSFISNYSAQFTCTVIVIMIIVIIIIIMVIMIIIIIVLVIILINDKNNTITSCFSCLDTHSWFTIWCYLRIKQQLNPIFILQSRKAVHAVTSSFDQHSSPLFKSLDRVKSFDLLSFLIEIYMYRFPDQLLSFWLQFPSSVWFLNLFCKEGVVVTVRCCLRY